MPHDMRSLESICAKNAKSVSERLKNKYPPSKAGGTPCEADGFTTPQNREKVKPLAVLK